MLGDSHHVNAACPAYLSQFERWYVITLFEVQQRQAGIPGEGIPGDDIQLLGRWKPEAYKDYIRVHLEHIHSVALHLQTFYPRDSTPVLSRPLSAPPVDSLYFLSVSTILQF